MCERPRRRVDGLFITINIKATAADSHLKCLKLVKSFCIVNCHTQLGTHKSRCKRGCADRTESYANDNLMSKIQWLIHAWQKPKANCKLIQLTKHQEVAQFFGAKALVSVLVWPRMILFDLICSAISCVCGEIFVLLSNN